MDRAKELDDKGVIPVAAIEDQLRTVVIDGEDIVARAAVEGQLVGDARADQASRVVSDHLVDGVEARGAPTKAVPKIWPGSGRECRPRWRH